MKRRYVARRLMARVLTVAMAASLVLQGASVPVYAAGDTDPKSQGGGVIEETLNEDESLEIIEETPAESPAETRGEDVPVPPAENPETTEETEVTAEEEVTVTEEALGAQIEGGKDISLEIGPGGVVKSESTAVIAEGSNWKYTVPNDEGANATEAIIAAIQAELEGANWGWKFSGFQIRKNGAEAYQDVSTTEGSVTEIAEGDTLKAVFAKKDYQITAEDSVVLALANANASLTPSYKNSETLTFTLAQGAGEGTDALPAEAEGLSFTVTAGKTSDAEKVVTAAEASTTAFDASSGITAVKNGDDTLTVTASVGVNENKAEWTTTVSVKVIPFGFFTMEYLLPPGAYWKGGSMPTTRIPAEADGGVNGLLAAIETANPYPVSGQINLPPGQQFDKWQIGETEIDNDTDFSAAASDEGVIRVTAVCKDAPPDSFDIYYEFFTGDNVNNVTELEGVTNPNSKTSYKTTDAEYILKNPSKSGYTFAGWYGSYIVEGGVTKLTGAPIEGKIEANSGGDRYFYGYFTENPVVNAIEFTSDTAYVQKEGTATAKVRVDYSGARPTVNFASLNPAYATVSSSAEVDNEGYATVTITGVKEGTVNVTAKAGGRTAVLKVTVQEDAVVPAKKVTLYHDSKPVGDSSSYRTIPLGDTGKNQSITLEATVLGDAGEATNQGVTWLVADEMIVDANGTEYSAEEGAVATVNTNGLVTIKPQKQNATFKVYATSKEDPSISAYTVVEVSKYYRVTFEDAVDKNFKKQIVTVKYGSPLYTATTGETDSSGNPVMIEWPSIGEIAGYEAAGWKDLAANPPEKVDFYEYNTIFTLTRDLTLTAAREEKELAITPDYRDASQFGSYNIRDINGPDEAALKYRVSDGEIDLIAEQYIPKLADYTFLGWFHDSDGDPETALEEIRSFLPEEYPEGITIHARFTRNVDSLVLRDSANTENGYKAKESYLLQAGGTLDTVTAVMTPEVNGDIPGGVTYAVMPEDGPISVDETGKVTAADNATVEDKAIVIATAGDVNTGGKYVTYIVQITDKEPEEIIAAQSVEIAALTADTFVYPAAAKGDSDTVLPATLELSATVKGAGDTAATDQAVSWTAVAKKGTDGNGAEIEGLVTMNGAEAIFDVSKLTTNAKVTFTATAASTTGDASPVKKDMSIVIKRYYKLTLDPKGGTFAETVNAEQWVQDQENLPALPSDTSDPKGITKTGYSLHTTTPWAVPDEEGAPSTTEVPAKINGADISLVAYWTARDVEFRFDYGKQEDGTTDLLATNTASATVKFGEVPDLTATDFDGHANREIGELITANAEPANYVMYRFDGWFEKTGETVSTTSYDFTKAVNTEGPVHLVAKTTRVYPVEFKAGDGVTFTGVVPEDQYIADGEVLSRPTDPTAAGKRFAGWKKGDAAFTAFGESIRFTDTEKAANGFELTAQWEDVEDKYTVTYDLGGVAIFAYKFDNAGQVDAQSIPDTENVAHGSSLTYVLAYPEDYDHYTFAGWYAGDRAWNFSKDTVTSDLMLKAKWQVEEYPVTFYLDASGTDTLGTIQVPYNGKASAADLTAMEKAAVDGNWSYGHSFMFKEWRKVGDDSVVDFRADDFAMGDQAMEVYAVVEEILADPGQAFEADFPNGIVVVTNDYAAGATVDGIDLKTFTTGGSFASDGTWSFAADKSTAKTVASYAKKGVVALPLTFTAVDGTVSTYTAPVRFVTITGITMVYDGTKFRKGDALFGATRSLTIIPVVAGGNYHDEAIADAVDAVLYSVIVGGKATGIQTSKNPENIIIWDSEETDFTVRGDVTAASTIALSFTLSFPDGNDVKGSTKVTVVPEGIEYTSFESSDLDTDDTYRNNTGGEVHAAFAKNLAKNATAKISGTISVPTGVTAPTKVTIKSDNTKIVKPVKGTVDVSGTDFSFGLKAGGGYGTAILTLTANDAAKTTATVCVTVYPEETSLSTGKATLNMIYLGGQDITITPGYDASLKAAEDIGTVSVHSAVPADKGASNKNTLPDDVLKTYFEVEQDGNRVTLKLAGETMDDILGMVPGKYAVQLADDGNPIGKPVTVTVTDKQPATTIKQKAPLNLNMKPEAGEQVLTVTTKAGEINGVRLEGVDSDAPFLITNLYGDTVEIKKNVDAPSVTKEDGKTTFTLAMDVTGYREWSIRKTFKVKVTDKLPVLKLSASSLTMYPGLPTQALTLSVDGIAQNDLDNATIALTGALATNYSVTTDAGRVVLSAKSSAVKAGGTLTYTNEALLEPGIVLSAKLNVKAGKVSGIKAKPAKSSVSLNANAENDMLYVPVSVTGLTGDYTYEIASVAADKADPAVEVLAGTDDYVKGKIGEYLVVQWKDGATRPTKGSSSFKVMMQVKDGADTVLHTTAAVKLTVKHGNKALTKSISFSQKGTIDLTKDTDITVTPKLTGLNGTYNGADIFVNLTGRDAALFEALPTGDGKIVIMPTQPASAYVTGYKYDVRIGEAFVLHNDVNFAARTGITRIENINKRLNITVKQTAPKMTLTPAGGTVSGTGNRPGNMMRVNFKATVPGAWEPRIKSITQVFDKSATDAFILKGIYDENGDAVSDSSFEGHGSLLIGQTRMVKKGTYTLKFLVVYEGQAANTKDSIVTFKVTVK